MAAIGFTLDHAKAHRMDRIIYGIPFTSIIDWTASIFRNVLGGFCNRRRAPGSDEYRQESRSQRRARSLQEKRMLTNWGNWAHTIFVYAVFDTKACPLRSSHLSTQKLIRNNLY
jgi:CRISPR-associated endonuclease/helicase Cas3